MTGHATDSRITKLYREKPLKEVVAIMEQNYNFVATQRMYKGYFQKWGIKKNVTGGQVRDASLRAHTDGKGMLYSLSSGLRPLRINSDCGIGRWQPYVTIRKAVCELQRYAK